MSIIRMLRFISLLTFLSLSVISCATSSRLEYQSISFDGRSDGWHDSIELLEYSYSSGGKSIVSESGQSLSFRHLGYVPSQAGINMPMPAMDQIYLKWRIKKSGEIFEKTISLASLLPKSMAMHTLTFSFENHQVYLFVVTPESTGSGLGKPKTHRTWLSAYRRTFEIYPNSELKPRQ